jgi:hypothetical protein
MGDKKVNSKYHMQMIILSEEGKRRSKITDILLPIIRMNTVSLSEYFGIQIKKNGKILWINPRSLVLTFTIYFMCAALLRELTIGNV